MLNSQLQHHQLHQSTPSPQQLHQLHAPDNCSPATNGLFLFDDLTTALRDHHQSHIDQTASLSSTNTSPMTMSDTAAATSLMYSAMVSPSTIHQLAQQLGSSPTTNMQQQQQNCCFGEFSKKKNKKIHTQNACKLRLLPSTIKTKHDSQLHQHLYTNHIRTIYINKSHRWTTYYINQSTISLPSYKASSSSLFSCNKQKKRKLHQSRHRIEIYLLFFFSRFSISSVDSNTSSIECRNSRASISFFFAQFLY